MVRTDGDGVRGEGRRGAGLPVLRRQGGEGGIGVGEVQRGRGRADRIRRTDEQRTESVQGTGRRLHRIIEGVNQRTAIDGETTGGVDRTIQRRGTSTVLINITRAEDLTREGRGTTRELQLIGAQVHRTTRTRQGHEGYPRG